MERALLWALLLALTACGAAPRAEVPESMPAPEQTPVPPRVEPPTSEPLWTPTNPFNVPDSRQPEDPVHELVIPTDQRAPVLAAKPPLPLSGGTLLVTRDEQHAVASDPDRDRISIVAVADTPTLSATIALEPGDRPGRLAEDDAGRVHAILRGGGSVLSLEVATGTVLGRRTVCREPRGIDYDANARALMVACASGELVRLPADPAGAVEPVARLEPDLRDVIAGGPRTFVSRFKRSELVAIDASGAQSDAVRPAPVRSTFPQLQGGQVFDTLAPTQAWRTLRAPDGRVLMLHQGSREGLIELGTSEQMASAVASPYGGGDQFTCGGAVQSELTVFDAEGALGFTVRLHGQLAIDAALSADGSELVVLFAGMRDAEQPKRSLQPVSSGSGGAGGAPARPPTRGPVQEPVSRRDPVTVYLLSALPDAADGCLDASFGVGTSALEPIAVATLGPGWVVQNREPAQLEVTVPGRARVLVDLGGESVADTGHALFHRDSGGGISCAACHGEGGEDGHVWNFIGFGPRRTQALHVGLEGTAPLHWAGDMSSVAELMEEVMVGRMGGVHQSPERTAALERWLFALRPPTPLRAADDPAVARGRELFAGAAACAGCHRGDKLTDNSTVYVGTGEPLQVPSLVGVGYRAPWIHTGCASTLRDRFDPSCGGADHGQTGGLSESELEDLIAYLESL